MANKRHKAAERLQGRGSAYAGTSSLVLTAAPSVIPRAPSGLQAGAGRAWSSFWRSPLASTVDTDADMTALRRWIHCVSERERLQPLADKTPLVKGSTGQLTANPLYGIIVAFSREIMAYEDRFGMTPTGRMRLGIAIGQAAESLDGLRKRLTATPPKRADVAPGEDGIIDLDGLA